MSTEVGKHSGKKLAEPGNFFKEIAKGDLVTIRGQDGERKGHAARRDHGAWVLVLERNMGTALATKENTLSVSKPRRPIRPLKVGETVIYNDGRKRVGKAVEVGPRSMYVLFDGSMEPSLIDFDDAQWMDYITLGP